MAPGTDFPATSSQKVGIEDGSEADNDSTVNSEVEL